MTHPEHKNKRAREREKSLHCKTIRSEISCNGAGIQYSYCFEKLGGVLKGGDEDMRRLRKEESREK